MSAQTPSRFRAFQGNRRRAALVVAGLGTALALAACSSGAVTEVAARSPLGNQSGSGYGGGGGGNGGGGNGGGGNGGYGGGPATVEARGSGAGDDVTTRIAALPVTTLTTSEIDGLRRMREEEKLAHDVYVALGETWGSRVFENIALSETTHMEAIKTLLDRHGIADPAAGQPVGVFTDPELQALHHDLVARGRTSLVNAFTVGALIEDLDISDLRERATDTPDIALVYEDLEQGSENHLRAFVRNLERQGGTYTPTYISVGEFEAIIGSSNGQGRSG
jgi:hypothetical protein